MKTTMMELRFKELVIISHALRNYINRPWVNEEDVRAEKDLLERIDTKVKLLKYKKGDSNGEK